ncbi:MFS transporter [Naumannella huperziae]
MSTTTSPSRELLRWRNAIFAIFFATGYAVASWMSRIPRLRDDLGASTGQMGLLVFTFSVGSIVSLSFSSHVIARFGARATIRTGLLMLAGGMLIAGLGTLDPNAPLIVAGLVVAGLGMGSTDVAMNFSGAAAERDLGKTVMPLFHAAFSFGTMAGAGVGALAAALGVPIAPQAVFAALLTAAIAATTVRIPLAAKPTDDDEPEPSFGERMAVWRHPATWAIGLVVLGMALTEGAANDWLALAAVDGRGMTDAQGAVVLGIFLTAMTVGRIAGVRVVDRIGRVRTVLATAIIAAVGLVAVIFVPHPVALYGGAALWGVGASLGFPLGMSAAADDPRNGAARVSAVATIGYLAFLAFPPLLGFLGDHIGILHTLLVVLVLIVAAALAAPSLRERARADRREMPEPTRRT